MPSCVGEKGFVITPKTGSISWRPSIWMLSFPVIKTTGISLPILFGKTLTFLIKDMPSRMGINISTSRRSGEKTRISPRLLYRWRNSRLHKVQYCGATQSLSSAASCGHHQHEGCEGEKEKMMRSFKKPFDFQFPIRFAERDSQTRRGKVQFVPEI